MVRFAWVVGSSILLLGCGGRVETDDSGFGGDSAEDSRDSGGAGEGPFAGAPTTPLGKCRLGEVVGVADTCPWMVERRCYATRDEACACACPHDKAHVICTSSDFDGEDGRVVVGCD